MPDMGTVGDMITLSDDLADTMYAATRWPPRWSSGASNSCQHWCHACQACCTVSFTSHLTCVPSVSQPAASQALCGEGADQTAAEDQPKLGLRAEGRVSAGLAPPPWVSPGPAHLVITQPAQGQYSWSAGHHGGW